MGKADFATMFDIFRALYGIAPSQIHRLWDLDNDEEVDLVNARKSSSPDPNAH
jgi:hypothetical protein